MCPIKASRAMVRRQPKGDWKLKIWDELKETHERVGEVVEIPDLLDLATCIKRARQRLGGTFNYRPQFTRKVFVAVHPDGTEQRLTYDDLTTKK